MLFKGTQSAVGTKEMTHFNLKLIINTINCTITDMIA